MSQSEDSVATCDPSVLIEQVMCEKFLAVDIMTPLRETVRRMRTENFSCCIVTAEENPVGIISERDLAQVLHDIFEARHDGDKLAGDVMTAPLVCVQHSATIHETLCKVEANKIRHIAVLGSKRELVGVITQTELLHALTWDLELERAQQKLELVNLVQRSQV